MLSIRLKAFFRNIKENKKLSLHVATTPDF